MFLSVLKDRLQSKQIFLRTFSQQAHYHVPRQSQLKQDKIEELGVLRRIYVSRIFVEIWNKKINSSMLQKVHIYYDIPSK